MKNVGLIKKAIVSYLPFRHFIKDFPSDVALLNITLQSSKISGDSLVKAQFRNFFRVVATHSFWASLTATPRKSGSNCVLIHDTKKECIPVGCVPPALPPYPSPGKRPMDRDTPWTETLLGQKPLWTETPPHLGQRHPCEQTGVKTLPSRYFVCGR